MRFTIRELILLTTIACLTLGWWRERQARGTAVKETKEAFADAKSLAFLSAVTGLPKGGFSGGALKHYHQLHVKYGVDKPFRSDSKISN